jgi:protein-tyrosine phosphatase
LSGAPNFRDAGGYPAANGRRVKTGALFRSDDLSRLSDADMEAIHGLAIQLILDLRSEGERKRRPSRWPGATAVHVLYADSRSAEWKAELSGLVAILGAAPGPDDARRMMLESYRLLPVQCAEGLGSVLAELARGRTPALIHCTAGKDRTGFVCACLHTALQVPREFVYADYLRSGEAAHLGTALAATAAVLEELLGLSIPPATVEMIGSVAPEFLDAAFDSIGTRFGSLEQYFEHCGADAGAIQAIREKLLEPMA